jgi:hypothetical protein
MVGRVAILGNKITEPIKIMKTTKLISKLLHEPNYHDVVRGANCLPPVNKY